MDGWKPSAPSLGIFGRKILWVGKFFGDGPACLQPRSQQGLFPTSEESEMIFPADSGSGRLKGCCSFQCAFKIGRTPVLSPACRRFRMRKSPASGLQPRRPFPSSLSGLIRVHPWLKTWRVGLRRSPLAGDSRLRRSPHPHHIARKRAPTPEAVSRRYPCSSVYIRG